MQAFYTILPLAPVVEANTIQHARPVLLMEIVTPDHRDHFRSVITAQALLI